MTAARRQSVRKSSEVTTWKYQGSQETPLEGHHPRRHTGANIPVLSLILPNEVC